MSEPSTVEILFLPLLDELLNRHPLPWHVDQDWATEVRSNDGIVLAKFPNEHLARALVSYAEARKVQNAHLLRRGEQFIEQRRLNFAN